MVHMGIEFLGYDMLQTVRKSWRSTWNSRCCQSYRTDIIRRSSHYLSPRMTIRHEYVSSLDLLNRCSVFQVVECEWFVQPSRHFKWAAWLVCLETKVAKFIASYML
jgi:hypothetical protein